MVVLPVMAAETRHLGLGITLSTTFHNPYHLARWLGSMDVMSGGRVAWNIVTAATELEARNVGGSLPPREERYDRADEVLEACCALWNSWTSTPSSSTKENGLFAQSDRFTTSTTTANGSKPRPLADTTQKPRSRPVPHAGRQLRPRTGFRRALGRAIFTDQRSLAALKPSTTTSVPHGHASAAQAWDCAIPGAASTFVIGARPSRSRANGRTTAEA